MSALADLIAARIGRFGPMSVADYMALCLLHPEHGYYTTRTALGRDGDFTTAPEISQMFGEILGLALAQAWIDQGAPAPFILAELGPGHGTLMRDLLRAAARAPGFAEAARIHLVEAGPAMVARQRAALADHAVVWHDRIEDLPEGPLFLIANEFFDALPVHQYVLSAEGWRERLVGLAKGRRAFGLGPVVPLSGGAVESGGEGANTEGAILEARPAAEAITGEIARRIGAAGGLALIADYGGEETGHDTFQAIRRHQKVDPLETPGKADLTAHVDFAALRRAAAPFCAVAGPVAQGAFLSRLGIGERSAALARGLKGEALRQHEAALNRLTGAQEMGTLFKVLALVPRDAALPAGFGSPEGTR